MGICVLVPLPPHFLESFFPCLLMPSTGSVRGELPPPSPHTSPLQLPNEAGTKDVCLLAWRAQLMAQQCLRNLCSATGAGKGGSWVLEISKHSVAVFLGAVGNSWIFICCSEDQQEGFFPPHTHYEPFGCLALFCPV